LTQNGQLHFFQLTNCDEGEKSCRPDIKIICKEGGRFQPIWDYTASLDLPDYVELYHFRLLNASTIAASSMNKLVVLNISDSIITIKYVFHYSLKGKSFNCVFILQRFDNGRL
jgi:hypothetical protein